MLLCRPVKRLQVLLTRLSAKWRAITVLRLIWFDRTIDTRWCTCLPLLGYSVAMTSPLFRFVENVFIGTARLFEQMFSDDSALLGCSMCR